MKKKVLITGASGFVGYHLIIEALRVGLEVYAAVRQTSKIDHLQSLNIHYTVLDFSSIEQLKRDIDDKQYNYIVHAAGTTKAKTAAEYNRINADYGKNLALAASQANIRLEKFIYVSSLAAIGPLAEFGTQIDEDTPPKPVTSYGRSKLLAERYLSDVRQLPLLIIRPTAVYGPRERDLLILFKTINKGIEPYIGKLNQQLSFIYVQDLAEVIIQALTSTFVKKVYNISDGEIYSRYSLSEIVKQALNKKTFRFYLPIPLVNGLAAFMEKLYERRANAPALNKEKVNELTAVNWACNIKRIREDLGYRPKVKLEEGLNKTLNWYKFHNWI